MNYRALEDLVNILVKKTGYKLNDLKLEEDIDDLEDRKKSLLNELDTITDKENLKSKYLIKSINKEIENIELMLDIKYNNPVILGNKLLDSYRNEENLDGVLDVLESLVKKARSEYEFTHEEVKTSNIFELMDKYSTKKRNYTDNLENNKYFSNDNKESMILRISYHNSRIEELKRELEVIDRKKEEVLALQNDAEDVIKRVHKDIETMSERLNSLVKDYYSEDNILRDNKLSNLINSVRYEIADLSYLEGKYNDDIKSYKSKVKELDSKVIETNERINLEEKLLSITEDLINKEENDLLLRFRENIEALSASNRVDNLVNEQQYLYVNVDVIKDEIIALWNKEGSKVVPKKEENIVEEEVTSSMYEEEYKEDTNEEETEELDNTIDLEEIKKEIDNELDSQDDSDVDFEVIDYLE